MAAWVGCVVTLALAVTGCGTDPPTSTHDRAAVDAALRAVRSARCPATSPALETGDAGSSLEPLVPNRLLLCGYSPRHIEGRPAGTVTAHALVTDQAVPGH